MFTKGQKNEAGIIYQKNKKRPNPKEFLRFDPYKSLFNFNLQIIFTILPQI